MKELGCVQLRSVVMGMDFCFVLTYRWQSLGEISPTEDPHLLKKKHNHRVGWCIFQDVILTIKFRECNLRFATLPCLEKNPEIFIPNAGEKW